MVLIYSMPGARDHTSIHVAQFHQVVKDFLLKFFLPIITDYLILLYAGDIHCTEFWGSQSNWDFFHSLALLLYSCFFLVNGTCDYFSHSVRDSQNRTSLLCHLKFWKCKSHDYGYCCLVAQPITLCASTLKNDKYLPCDSL